MTQVQGLAPFHFCPSPSRAWTDLRQDRRREGSDSLGPTTPSRLSARERAAGSGALGFLSLGSCPKGDLAPECQPH